MFITSVLSVLAILVCSSSAAYVLQDDYMSSGFFNMFDFFTADDPTHGYVDYVDQTTAHQQGLIVQSSGGAYIGVDYKNVASGRGRNSIRLSSKKAYTRGLIVLDLAHMPGGQCGAWPALTFGPDWPNSGEIDIIEGVNSGTANADALHTSSGCSVDKNSGNFTGTMTTSNCDVNAPGQYANVGCGVASNDASSYGKPFSANGGGVYATEWTSDAISIWYFPRSAIPRDLSTGNPNPSGWGKPAGKFEGACKIDDKFKNHNIIFDVTFCGDWAGSVWQNDAVCSPKASTCQAFVQNNPAEFTDAYWQVNSLRVYQSATTISNSSPSTSTTSSRSSSSSSVSTSSRTSFSSTTSRTSSTSSRTSSTSSTRSGSTSSTKTSSTSSTRTSSSSSTRTSTSSSRTTSSFTRTSTSSTRPTSISSSTRRTRTMRSTEDQRVIHAKRVVVHRHDAHHHN